MQGRKHDREMIPMKNYKTNIQKSDLTIYDEISPSNDSLYIPNEELQKMLASSMVGVSLFGLPLRTRSKVVKSKICEALGYPIPKSFKKTKPRFVGQNFDVYTQKSFNVQIWNEDIELNRRYVFLQVTENDIINRVKVITGAELASYDNTGTLTKKYQATMNSRGKSVLFSPSDTNRIKDWVNYDLNDLTGEHPNNDPQNGKLLSLQAIYNRLLPLAGKRIAYVDALQERNRGAELHKLVCHNLGYSTYEDDGTYPDIMNQLIEIKLQTSPTIDLGFHSPEDGETIFSSTDKTFYSEDVRYVIFDGIIENNRVTLRYLYVVNGRDFTKAFPLFKGKETNAKLQLPLPRNFFA